jgi:hypothetical protein
MNTIETQQAAAVMIASETKNIQERYRHGKSDDGWVDCPDPDWDWDSFEYRVAQEPTDVEVWVHPDGRICRSEDQNTQNTREFFQRNGWTPRRATIHPEEQ